MSGKKIKEQRARVLIYIRYLLPVILCVALLGTAFIPCLRYSIAGTTQSEVSTVELMENTWNFSREYLFDPSNQDDSVLKERFSWTALILVPVLVLLFAVGFISTAAVAIGGLLYINSREFRKTDARIWFITLLPNRVVACILHALVLPMLFYSRIVILLYDKIMRIDMLFNTSFPEPWVFGLIAYAVTVTLCVVSAALEKKYDADQFKKITPPVVRVVDPDEETEEEKAPTFKTEADRLYYENQKRAREEQAERIRQLLNKDERD